ncbi:MAG: hypothetical protein HZB13_03215 [Acidobacteria bacterium]|nr:hypothetical protein [Acidobacteriota bacterium]
MKRLAALLVLSVVAEAAPPAPPALAVIRPTLHHKQEDGPAIPANYEYYSGELLYLSFRVQGFKALKDKVDLRWMVVATDPDGLLLTPAVNGAISEELAVEDKNWQPKVSVTLALPAQLGPGTYRLKISVTDELASASAESVVEFQVGGRPFPKVEKFSVLNLRFLKDEADRQAMEQAVYRSGETLVAKFELAGFRLGEKNRFEVDYGLAVLSAAGKVLYEQPSAASDEGAPFYPRRLLNGALTLNLTAGVQAGDYALVVKARDKVGQTEAEMKATFTVTK